MAVARDKKFRAFDAALGRVVASKRELRSMSQQELSTRSGIPLTNLGRVEAGTRSLTVAELETVADVLRIPAATMAAEAVELYGGIELLMSEAQGMTDDLKRKRLQREMAAKTSAEIDEHRERKDTPSAAQRRDAETEADEPDAP